jgi:transcription antitermination protein NusB
MQTQSDPRHAKRMKIVQELFAASFDNNQTGDTESELIWNKRAEIDPLIEQTAPDWPLDKLNKIDLAILRLAIWELMFDKKQPVRVIIDEAVELGKDMGSENSPSFINGVLGTIVKQQNLE